MVCNDQGTDLFDVNYFGLGTAEERLLDLKFPGVTAMALFLGRQGPPTLNSECCWEQPMMPFVGMASRAEWYSRSAWSDLQLRLRQVASTEQPLGASA